MSKRSFTEQSLLQLAKGQEQSCQVIGVAEFLMSTVDEVLRGLESLTPDDRRKVIDWMLGNPRPLSGIEADPRVCGGEPRIVRTRIPVWTLEQMRRQGIPESDILKSFPALRAEDLVNAWNYVDAHPSEIESEIRENEEA
jgi:uncharacterized protein (DUF433 family)